MVDEAENVNTSNNLSMNKNYLKLHTTVVPIGTNFQADLPDIMAANTYLYRNQDAIRRLRSLKIHDPA